MAESSRGTRGTRAKRATVGSPDPQEHATRPKAQQKLGQCDLCETSLQPRKIYILKAEEVTGYNSLLAQVTGRNIPDTQHLIRKVWTASRCSSAKELSAGSKVCKVCWVTDNRRIQKLHETHDPMLLPRYWEKGEMATLGPGLKGQELCSVCMCSPEARKMLREGASTSAGSSQPALYSSSKYVKCRYVTWAAALVDEIGQSGRSSYEFAICPEQNASGDTPHTQSGLVLLTRDARGNVTPSINKDAALRFIASRFLDSKVTRQLCGLDQYQFWREASAKHEHRQSDFMSQLEDVLYSGNPNQIPMGAADNTSNIDSYLDILRRASFASKGDERQVIPSATAMRINLRKVEYCMCMVYESVSLDNSAVRDKHEDYGWRNEGEGVSSLWDIINGQEITSTRFPARIPSAEETSENQAGSAPGAKPKGCGCKPKSDGRCCVSRACACRKSEGGPRACSSSCLCQKLIKQQQKQQGDSDQRPKT